MANVVIMPQIGLNETSNLISTWNKNVGDKVKAGDVLFSIETDKSSMEVESEYEGVLLKRLYEEGDACDVLSVVCIIGREDEDISRFLSEDTLENEIEKPDSEVSMKDKKIEFYKKQDGVLKISPRAKKLGIQRGLDLNDLVGTGPEGRVIERDIYAFIEKGPIMTKAAALELGDRDASSFQSTGLGGRILSDDVSSPQGTLQVDAVCEEEFQVEKFTNIRKVIAKNMMKSLQSTAQLTLHASFDATDIMGYRNKIKNHSKLNLGNITLNDMLMYAVSRTVNNFKNLNAHILNDEEIKVFSNVHLGFACDTNKGLMVPTLFNSNKMTLNEISIAAKELAVACQRGNIDPVKLQGATFTVSNLGSLGIENFTPVLNPPQTGILGIGSIEYKVKKVGDNFIEYPAMFISLTFDHRAIDGAPAAKFLQTLKENLENFYLLLAK